LNPQWVQGFLLQTRLERSVVRLHAEQLAEHGREIEQLKKAQ
jgi:hypothetical protein